MRCLTDELTLNANYYLGNASSSSCLLASCNNPSFLANRGVVIAWNVKVVSIARNVADELKVLVAEL